MRAGGMRRGGSFANPSCTGFAKGGYRAYFYVMAEVDSASDPLRKRVPKTQKAISEAMKVVDGSILVDNSCGLARAVTVCRVQLGTGKLFDMRDRTNRPPGAISEWLSLLSAVG